ncbi:MAG TPA: hypothetical protein VFV52_05960 [Bacilli bacterium]|nr:hypothetical protein [Bacilli bacterium]
MWASVIPLAASLIALCFAVILGRQYGRKHGLHQLWWAISMLSYACASYGEFYALAFGWNVGMYLFYYFNAISLVAIMAAGEMYMLFRDKFRWIGHLYAGAMVAAMLVLVVLLTQAETVTAQLASHDAAIGGEGLPQDSLIRSLFPALLSGIGGTILIIGPLWSWFKTRFRGNLYIAGGALLLSAAGRLAKMGYPEWLPISELIGIAIIFYGVVLFSARKKPLTGAEQG